jgi:hypothetical protein
MHCGIPNAYNNSIVQQSYCMDLTLEGLKMTQESRNMWPILCNIVTLRILNFCVLTDTFYPMYFRNTSGMENINFKHETWDKERHILKYILKKPVENLWTEFTQETAVIALKNEY